MRVRSCCCGASLKVGCILIGVFNLIFYAPGWFLILIFGFDEHIRGRVFYSDAVEGLGTEQRDLVFNIGYVLTLSALGFGIFMNVALILGSIYKKTTLLYIWFVVYILVIIVMTIIVIVNSFSREVESSRRVPWIAFSLVYKLIILYFLVVVHSYYKEIKEERAREYYDNVRRLKELQRQHQLQQFQCQQYHQPPMNVFTVSSAVPTAPLHTPEPTAPMEPLPAYLPPIRPVY